MCVNSQGTNVVDAAAAAAEAMAAAAQAMAAAAQVQVKLFLGCS